MKRGANQQGRTRRAAGLMISAVMLAALMVAPLPSASAGDTTVRSGTIVTGGGYWDYFVGEGRLDGCEMSPECRAWLASGCRAALPGHKVGPTASIEDVGDLAGDSQWLFEFGTDRGFTGVAEVQFWRRDCMEIRHSGWRANDCDRDGRDDYDYCRSAVLKVPPSARWMTVTGWPYIGWGTELLREPLVLNWTLRDPRGRGRD